MSRARSFRRVFYWGSGADQREAAPRPQVLRVLVFRPHRTDRSRMPQKTHAASPLEAGGASRRSNSFGARYCKAECKRFSLYTPSRNSPMRARACRQQPSEPSPLRRLGTAIPPEPSIFHRRAKGESVSAYPRRPAPYRRPAGLYNRACLTAPRSGQDGLPRCDGCGAPRIVAGPRRRKKPRFDAEALVWNWLRLRSCAGEQRKSSRVAAKHAGYLQEIERRNLFVMDLGVASDFCECTRLVKPAVKALDLIGETTDLVD